jgi:outer membrane protein TolC
VTGLAVSATLLAGACQSPDEYKEAADEEVYALVDSERARLGLDAEFTIEPPESSMRTTLLDGMELTEPLALLDLLALAAENSRDYQTRKESVYRTALDVTRQRWLLFGIGGAGVDADLSGSGNSAETLDVTPSASLTRVLGSGATIVLGATWNFAKTLPNGGVQSTVSGLLDVRQPLMRGFGRRILGEPLTQAERDLVYEVRAFERFRRTFGFDVAQRMYRILQQVNRVENEVQNLANLVLLRERNEAMAEAGRLSEIQVDQARQDELRAENRVIVAEVDLGTQLDNFKLFLGLPIETSIAIDPEELDRLAGELLAGSVPDEDEAVTFALRQRLDYMTVLEQVEDAERKIGVAADALRMGLDLTGGLTSISSESGQPFDFDLEDLNWSLGVSVDLPVNRLLERNVYRQAVITRNASTRSADQLGDSIVADVRADGRDLRAARENYEIQTSAVDLGRRRIESTKLNLQAGRATTRDLLEAQDALVNSENAATGALIEYTLARLGLFLDLELLQVDEGGIRIASMDEVEGGRTEP